MMTSVQKADNNEQKHLERTAENSRENVLANATVVDIKNVSDTIKKLSLKIHDRTGHFNFKAGQWVDFFIPALSTVGGYSMCSSPELWSSQGILELAVKFSRHPPAYWIHEKCKQGSQVQLRVGGDFYYDPDPADQSDLLLIAGGVGINPILSIMKHVYDLNKDGNALSSSRVHLLYSACREQELVFKDSIEEMCSELPSQFQRQYFITKEMGDSSVDSRRRISSEDIMQALRNLDRQKLACFICGPSSMIDTIEGYLISAGVSKNQVHYEKWW